MSLFGIQMARLELRLTCLGPTSHFGAPKSHPNDFSVTPPEEEVKVTLNKTEATRSPNLRELLDHSKYLRDRRPPARPFAFEGESSGET